MYTINKDNLLKVYLHYSPHSSPDTRFFMSVDSHSLSRIEWKVRSTPRPAKLSAHLGDTQATGYQNPNLFYLRNNATK